MIGSVLRVRYELTKLLFEGPIFTTYAASDRVQGREICVRIIRTPFSEEPIFVQKIRDVVQKYAGIQHPGVESMLEVDDDEGSPFLLTELTHGLLLGDRIRKLAPFSVPVAVSTAISLCEGLESIHSFGLAHGDVTSQNSVSLPDGQVRLQLPGMWQAYATSPGAAAAVLPSMSPYLAPEISAGAMPSPVSDVYSAGVLLYELITGRLPYNADTPISMALKHATGTVPSVRMYNPSVPVVLDEIVKKALSKDVAQRYPTAGALLSDLRVLQDALRFGRTVTWPITIATVAPQVTPMPKTTAVRKDPPKTEPRVKRERDVPLYLWIPITIFGAMFATLVGVYYFYMGSKPPQVRVPPLAGLTVSEARDRVRTSKLDIEIAGERSSEKVDADHIISSEPDSGDTVREGSKIRVTISTGSHLVQVPSLKGSTVDAARTTLMALHLELDDNYQEQPSTKFPKGQIMSQTPSAGSKIDPSTKVKVVLSTGDEEGDNQNDAKPIAVGEERLYTLKFDVSGVPKQVRVRIDIVDDKGVRTVLDEDRNPDEAVVLTIRGTGKQVTFNIYYDNALVKTLNQTAELGTPVPPGEDNNQ